MHQIQIRHVRDRLEQLYTHFIDLSDTRQGQDKTNYFLTRSLSAFAIQSLTNSSNEVIAKSITDGFDDNGIDAIYFDDENKELYFVQAKWNHKGTKTPEDGEVKKFTDGIRDIIEFRFDHFNEKIKSRKEELKMLISKPGIKLRIILTHTGVGLSEHAMRTLNKLTADQNLANEDDTAMWINFDLKKLHRVVLGDSALDPINLDNIILNEWAMKEKPKKSFYGRITGDQLAKWWSQYGDKLFAKNIRHLLTEGDVHKEISKTIDSEPDNFWYFNNGITMICDSVEKATAGGDRRDFGIFECKNVFIINGAQTVGTIGKYALKQEGNAQEESKENSVKLEDIDVLVRIISVSGEEEQLSDKFAQQLTKANNRQNRIENRDFVTLDVNQKRIAQELAFYNITYNYKRSAEEQYEYNVFGLVESTLALSYAFSDVDAATLMHREPSKVWENTQHIRYRRLFNSGTTSFYVWNTVLAYREILKAMNKVKKKQKNEVEAVLTHGDHFIAHLLFRYIDSEKINKQEIGIDNLFDKFDLEKSINSYAVETVKTIQELVGDEKTISGVFKTYTLPRKIKEQIIANETGSNTEEKNTESIDSLIETKFANDRSLIKNRIANFDEKISGDALAEEGFLYWLDNIYNPDKDECGVVSNIHHYKKGVGNKDKRFILRIKYQTKLVIEFNHSSFGSDYVSLLYLDDEFQEWLLSNEDDKGKIFINQINDIKKIEQLKPYIDKL